MDPNDREAWAETSKRRIRRLTNLKEVGPAAHPGPDQGLRFDPALVVEVQARALDGVDEEGTIAAQPEDRLCEDALPRLDGGATQVHELGPGPSDRDPRPSPVGAIDDGKAPHGRDPGRAKQARGEPLVLRHRLVATIAHRIQDRIVEIVGEEPGALLGGHIPEAALNVLPGTQASRTPRESPELEHDVGE